MDEATKTALTTRVTIAFAVGYLVGLITTIFVLSRLAPQHADHRAELDASDAHRTQRVSDSQVRKSASSGCTRSACANHSNRNSFPSGAPSCQTASRAMWNWFADSLRACPELALFLAIAVGFAVGPRKLWGFSLGSVTATLLAAIAIGQMASALQSIPLGYAVAYTFGTIGSAILLAQVGPNRIGFDLAAGYEQAFEAARRDAPAAKQLAAGARKHARRRKA